MPSAQGRMQMSKHVNNDVSMNPPIVRFQFILEEYSNE